MGSRKIFKRNKRRQNLAQSISENKQEFRLVQIIQIVINLSKVCLILDLFFNTVMVTYYSPEADS
jgi:glutathione synthase/RimK-type ligase-like ATP-grasp enzyme